MAAIGSMLTWSDRGIRRAFQADLAKGWVCHNTAVSHADGPRRSLDSFSNHWHRLQMNNP
ncbi:MAG: hypothetical protein NVSMB6_06960 [Burkholderiaceae bacterium]